MKINYTIDDGIQLHNEAPESFTIPSATEISKLEVGDIVKLIFRQEGYSPERMWVKITNIDSHNKNFEGILDNEPYYLTAIKYQDNIKFSYNHIIAISE